MESHPLRLPRSMSSTLTRWWLFVSLACPHIPSEISKTITGNQESVSRCDVQLFPWTRFRLALTNDQRLRRQLLRWLRQPSLVRVSFFSIFWPQHLGFSEDVYYRHSFAEFQSYVQSANARFPVRLTFYTRGYIHAYHISYPSGTP